MNETSPDNLSPIDKYLALAREVLTLDGCKIIGELSIAGCEYLEGKSYLSVSFTDERGGLMTTVIPAPQSVYREI